MNVSCSRVTRIHVVGSRKSLAILDGLGDLVRRPSALRHSILPLLGSVIAAELPAGLTWHTALSSCIERTCGETVPDASPFYPNTLVKKVTMRLGAAFSRCHHCRQTLAPLQRYNWFSIKKLHTFLSRRCSDAQVVARGVGGGDARTIKRPYLFHFGSFSSFATGDTRTNQPKDDSCEAASAGGEPAGDAASRNAIE